MRNVSMYVRGRRVGTPPDEGRCPTPKTHKRIQDCHDQWHALARAYHRPEAFRRELNALVQSLRNVTFILQAEKKGVVEFDSWYGPWQVRMRESQLMRWVVESRNRVVKQGDLNTRSVATASLVATYEKQAPEAASDRHTIEVPPATTVKEQIRRLSELPSFVMLAGYIELRREWVDEALPGRELVGACAEAFSFLNHMLEDLHRHVGMDSTSALTHGGEPVEFETSPGGLPPCMTLQDFDVMRMRLSNGSVDVGGTRFTHTPDAKNLRMATKRYGEPPEIPRPEEWETVADLAEWYMGTARLLMKKDRKHGWYVFLFKGKTVVASEILIARDKPDQLVMMRELATVVERSGIDGVVEVGDCWMSEVTMDDEGFPVPPALHPRRTEAISVAAEDAYGNRKYLHSPYVRRGRRIDFAGEPVDMTSAMTVNTLQPIREAWKRMGLSHLDETG